MRKKAWMEAFGEIKESYLTEAMETEKLVEKKKKKRNMNWIFQYTGAVACVCIMMTAIVGGVLHWNGKIGPDSESNDFPLQREEADEMMQDLVTMASSVTDDGTIGATKPEVITENVPVSATNIVEENEVTEEIIEMDIAFPEGAFFAELDEEKIASIWGQEALKWGELAIADDYLTEGNIIYDGEGKVWTSTLYGYQDETQKEEGMYAFKIEFSPEQLPPTCEIYDGDNTEIWNIHDTKIHVQKFSNKAMSYTSYELTFIRELPEKVGCKAVFRMEDAAAKALAEEMVNQSLDPQKTLQLSQLNTEETPDILLNDFAVRLLRMSIKENENILLSPLSVSTALAMTANGADGRTKAQMEDVFGLSVSSLNQYFYDYLTSVSKEEIQNLVSANSVWIKDDPSLTVEEDFLNIVQPWYAAETFTEEFNKNTLKKINDWVKKNTNDMIPQILDKMDGDAVMYLVNAIAFDAKWTDVYYERQVRPGTFTLSDGTETEVDMMYSEEYRYLEDEHAKGFIKPYEGRRYAFAALLPDENISVEEYAASLTGERLHQILSNMKQDTINAAIPRFTSGYRCELSDVLKKMGMTDAFEGELADFSKMAYSANGNILINRVIHQTSFALDELGTKAGAATVVEMVEETAMITEEEPKEVYLDRPFLYMIIDCKNNTSVFIGILNDPSSDGSGAAAD